MALATLVSHLAAVAPLDDMLCELLAVSLTGVILYTPLYDAAGSGEIVDFRFEYLNPAAQRMMGMAERPTVTHHEQWPHSQAHGTFAFHVDAFISGEARQYNINYQADGYDNYYRLAARRVGQGLLVSFTDTADQPRTPVEEALRASQAREQAARAETEAQRRRLYHILEQFPAVVASYRGPNHVFDLVSHRFQRDFPTRTIKGLPVREALPELEGQGYFDILDGVYHTGEPFYGTELETWVDLTGTGKLELQYYNVCFQATRDSEGRIDGCLNFAYDVTSGVLARQQLEQLNQELEARVTERTQAALALQADLLAAAQRQAAQRALLYQVFEDTPAAICIQRGPEHRYEYVNPAYQALFPNRRFVGHTLAEALPETRDGGIVALLDQVYRTGEPFFGFEVPLTLQPTAPGEAARTEYYTFTYQAYREDGQIVGISTFAYNVTEQARARQEREAQQRKFYTLFEQAPIGICIFVGSDLVYEFVNASYQWLRPGRPLLGRPLREALPELIGTDVESRLRRVYETGETQQEQELLLPVARADGYGQLENRYFTVVYQARRDEQGCVNGILNFVVEVTEQVLARQRVQELNQELTVTIEELSAANTRLSRTNVDLDNFIYSASHDLKAPISNIEGLLQLLHADLPADVAQGPAVAPTLEMMGDSVERFKRTIEHLTEVSKLQKEHTPATTAVDLAVVVEDVRQDLAPLVQAAEAHVQVDVTDFPPVLFSEKNLRSVVYNLLSNALKYRSPDRTLHIDVRAHIRPGFTVLEVHDNGLGLDATHLPQLFTMFQRFHDHVEGTGIGLYMVKRMIENVGGKIEVHSQAGAGTTFFVYLPQAALPSSPA